MLEVQEQCIAVLRVPLLFVFNLPLWYCCAMGLSISCGRVKPKFLGDGFLQLRNAISSATVLALRYGLSEVQEQRFAILLVLVLSFFKFVAVVLSQCWALQLIRERSDEGSWRGIAPASRWKIFWCMRGIGVFGVGGSRASFCDLARIIFVSYQYMVAILPFVELCTSYPQSKPDSWRCIPTCPTLSLVRTRAMIFSIIREKECAQFEDSKKLI